MLSENARQKHNKAQALALVGAGMVTISTLDKKPILGLWTKRRINLTSDDVEKYHARCERDGKTPAQLCGSASTAEHIAQNFKNAPNAGVGLNCGESGYAVLDLDIKKKDGKVVLDGVKRFMGLFEAHGFDLSSTFVVDTPSGGLHVYFYDPKGMATRHCGATEGFDLKAAGGHVVAPDTYREDGGHYKPRPFDGMTFAEAAAGGYIPVMPEWLKSHIRAVKGSKTQSAEERETEDARLDGIEVDLGRDLDAEVDPSFDFDAIARDNAKFTQAIRGELKSTSDARFEIALTGRSILGSDRFTPVQFRAYCMSLPACGEYVIGAAKQGQFNDRNIARDWNRAPVMGEPITSSPGKADEIELPADDAPAAGAPKHPGPAASRAELMAYSKAKDLWDAYQADPSLAAKLQVQQQAIQEEKRKKAAKGLALPSARPFRALRDIPPTAWVVYPLFASAVVGALIGPGGVAKSRLAVAELLAVVTGRPEIAGWSPDAKIERTSVWFHCQEDSLDEIDSRIAALAERYNIDLEEYDGTNGFTFHRGSGVDEEPLLLAWRGDDGRSVVVNPQLPKIEAFIIEHRVGLYAVDPIVELHELEENHSGEMRQVWGALRQIATKTGAHVLAIAHSRKADGAKSDGRPGDMNTLRGSGAATGVIRMARTVLEMTEAEATALGVELNQRAFYMRVDDAKNNLAIRRMDPVWYERASVERDGDVRNNVGIVIPATMKSLRGGGASQPRPAVKLSELAEAVRDAIRKAPAGTEHAIHDVAQATPALAAKYGDDAEKARKSFKRDVFRGADRIAVSDGWLVWTTVKGRAGSTLRYEPGAPGQGDQTEGFGAVEE